MAWSTPKTNWKVQYNEEGVFTGDFFNVADYNRIKNNLVYLRDLATEMFEDVPEITVGANKHVPNNTYSFANDHFFADEINLIEDGLEALDERFEFVDFGNKQTFYDNGRFIDYQELNRIERAELELYDFLTYSIAGRPKLAFKLGTHRVV